MYNKVLQLSDKFLQNHLSHHLKYILERVFFKSYDWNYCCAVHSQSKGQTDSALFFAMNSKGEQNEAFETFSKIYVLKLKSIMHTNMQRILF